MKFVKVKYFKTGTSLCGDDFRENEKSINLNTDFISEISDITSFKGYVGALPTKDTKYFWIRMSNSSVYNCKESQKYILFDSLIHTNDESE